MNKKLKSKANQEALEKDNATFVHLPEKTQDLMNLKDKEEKTTGLEHVKLTRKIRDKTRKEKQ